MSLDTAFELLWKFINSNWSATILGWILGAISAYLATRRQAAMQAQTIKTLSDALAAFESKFKDQLEPLDTAEQEGLAQARQVLIDADREPKVSRIFLRAVRVPPLALVISIGFLIVPVIIGAIFPPEQRPWYLTAIVVIFIILAGFGGIVTAVTILGFSQIYRDERGALLREQLRAAQVSIRGLTLTHKQFDHLRRWVSQHPFQLLARSAAQEHLEYAAMAGRTEPAAS